MASGALRKLSLVPLVVSLATMAGAQSLLDLDCWITQVVDPVAQAGCR
jgi:hypothetical protein